MVQLIGNLTRDPELRFTPQGTAVCTFGLATNREWTDQSGQKTEETEFHRVVAWHKLAELCSQLLFKGRKVYVEGRLQTRKWTGADNQERQTTEVVIDNMIILDNRRKEGGEGAPGVNMGSSVPAPTPAAAPVPAKVVPVADDTVQASKPAAKVHKKTTKDETQEKVKAETNSEEVKADDIPF
ncbi:hypothetical protein A2160_01935 [Candidatus Beckwithbacteria bacterium RBG_13_42_9]|uniref:Single-stranded DNA-binding protein n=1 Tax=Candidatus Beckwithbacteria bacterium RBG_13_42_9 TaxID=1797457 RepID=A0A1F5E8B4_9BACT|nr:MAG: hypothetical protein A2160_01935 [Candidatus Beckwithbacteria bacterium RBG_13_42_9]